MLKKKFFLENLDFFSSKRKNHETPRRATARYTHDFWEILLLKNIYALRRMRSTQFRATHVIRLATKMPFIKLKKSSSQRYIGHFETCHMGAPNSFGSKKSRKKNQNFTNFFFRKIEYKTRSGTQFHQKGPHRTDFDLPTARHENFTSSESGPNSRGGKLIQQLRNIYTQLQLRLSAKKNHLKQRKI